MAEPREEPECLPYLRALSDENRYRIVQLLTTLPSPITLGDLADRLGLSTYNASKHIRILDEAGILCLRKEGRFKYISIDDDFLTNVKNQPGGDVLDLGCCKFDFSKPAAIADRNIQLRKEATIRNLPAMSSPARYIMIGGFLGAGKTTAVAALARHLSDSGKRVGLITNDQGRELVDTKMLRSRGFATEEIAGGCFCCKFNSLVDAADRLTEEATPEVFVAEPVGSCTDLVATVTYPLRRIYGEQFTIAPLSVLVDPMRARRILGMEEGRSFSEKVRYIYLKQLEEADIIVISKSDLLEKEEIETLRSVLEEKFPKSRVIAISARNEEGLAPWFNILESEEQIARAPMEVDYDEYAEGEALLGWLNATIVLEVPDEIDAGPLLESLAAEIQIRLGTAEAEVAHLKMTLSPENAFAGEVTVINLVRSDFCPEFGQELDEPITGGQIILNLRAEGDPEMLESAVKESLKAVSSTECQLALEHLERFRPSPPVPTHRDA